LNVDEKEGHEIQQIEEKDVNDDLYFGEKVEANESSFELNTVLITKPDYPEYQM
jgi:hypothetical protein